MEEYDNPDPNAGDTPTLSQPESVITPFGPPSGRPRNPSAFVSSGRVEANTALLKIGQNSVDVSGFEHDPLDGKSGITPVDDDDGGDAASARIAQEYRRQIRIKRLAEEINLTERAKKKEDEQRRKTETAVRKPRPQSKKDETAKLDMDQTLATPADSEATLAKKRAVAMDAFKTASTGHKSKSGLITALVFLLFFGALAAGAWMFLNRLAAQKDKTNRDEVALRSAEAKKAEENAIQVVKNIQAHEADVMRQKLADAEEAKSVAQAKTAELEKNYLQKEADRQKAIAVATEKRLAEEKRFKEENDRVLELANREKEDLRKTIETSQRLAREKRDKELADEAARANGRKPDLPTTDVAKSELPKPEVTKPDLSRPDGARVIATKPDNALTGDVKTIPSDPPIVPDKIELPSGGVRLLVKASDPYGGKLTFQWRQLKGLQVDIADPIAAKFVDSKWVSQTYFVARQPGNYEFEVTVKNDEGVESRKKFPIEVLPPTTLK